MSMIGNYLRLPEAELQKILASPESIGAVLYPEEDTGLTPESQIDTDKAWHLTHFLLTGEAWGGAEPLCNAVLGGVEIGEEDVGYGPARYLTPAQVQAVAEALAVISPAELWSRFDHNKIREAEIYPSVWEDNETDRDYILSYFETLRTFFADAAQEQEAMILYLN